MKATLEQRSKSCSKQKLDASTLEPKLAASILRKLAVMPGLTVSESSTMFAAIADAGLSEEFSATFSDAVDEKLSICQTMLMPLSSKGHSCVATPKPISHQPSWLP